MSDNPTESETKKTESQKKWPLGTIFYFLIVIVSFACLLVFHCLTQDRFADTYESIKQNHDSFCKSIAINNKVLAKDSVLVLDATILDAIKEESKAFESNIDLLSSRINDQQSGLTLWASALMIIFLVFSIYSMYKIDEMQKQGHDAISKLHALHLESKHEYERIETEFKQKQTTVFEDSNKRLDNLKESIETQKNNLITQTNKLIGTAAKVSEALSQKESAITNLGVEINSKAAELDNTINSKHSEFEKKSEQSYNDFKSKCDELVQKLKAEIIEEQRKAIEELKIATAPPPSPQPGQDGDVTTSEERYEEAFDSIKQQATPDEPDSPDDTEP